MIKRNRVRRLIIPVFIPHEGCPHQCVFCNQKGITGQEVMPTESDIRRTISAYLASWKGGGTREVAFYGGSFTGLEYAIQERLLKTVLPFIDSGSINSTRISTRPDYIFADNFPFFRRYCVKTIELGVQSMNDNVLRLSGRGHTASDTVTAARMLREDGFITGVQLMPGLPGDNRDIFLETIDEVIRLKPDFVRIYPVLVISQTPLAMMYADGSYMPWQLDHMVDLCREALLLLRQASIPVIRMGLQPTRTLERHIMAGPYHPSFRQVVEKGLEVS